MLSHSRFASRLVHGTVLGATGWLLLATSAPSEPNRDCFVELGDEVSLRVALGEAGVGGFTTTGGAAGVAQTVVGGEAGAAGSTAMSGIAGGGGIPSCAGLDGLIDHAELTLELEVGPRSDEYNGGCYGYRTNTIQGLTGVTLDKPANPTGNVLTNLSGGFLSPTADACRGTWTATLAPAVTPAAGELMSPYEAGKSEQWVLHRSMHIEQAQFCDGAFSVKGELNCQDDFVVTQIEEVAK